jgi:2-polyprenyl-3-methyl-5-hydroxy-6-metoxy-1,4-benzoquinol methylase
MDNFIRPDDPLAALINEKGKELYARLKTLPVEALGMPRHCLDYFLKSHHHRLFFSVETSAHLLYRSLKKHGHNPVDVIVMDYGAGVGSLYMLAKLIGCRVVYNDLLDDWKKSAELIANACGITIDEYIVGDINTTLDILASKNISCNIITSRNVIEHIYKLEDFYNSIHTHQAGASVYSSTTANYYNPAAHIQHIRWHRKCEHRYVKERAVLIKNTLPDITKENEKKLARATRGLAMEELQKAIVSFKKGVFPVPTTYYTNTCDPSNGVWAEHLLKFSQYMHAINENHFKITFQPGFWDTHYSSSLKSAMGKAFNKIISKGGKKAFWLAPFIYVIAEPHANN